MVQACGFDFAAWRFSEQRTASMFGRTFREVRRRSVLGPLVA